MLHRMLQDLLVFARPRDPVRASGALRAVISETWAALKLAARQTADSGVAGADNSPSRGEKAAPNPGYRPAAPPSAPTRRRNSPQRLIPPPAPRAARRNTPAPRRRGVSSHRRLTDRQNEIDRLQAEIKALSDVEQFLGAFGAGLVGRPGPPLGAWCPGPGEFRVWPGYRVDPGEVCALLAAILALGCSLGLIDAVTGCSDGQGSSRELPRHRRPGRFRRHFAVAAAGRAHRRPRLTGAARRHTTSGFPGAA